MPLDSRFVAATLSEPRMPESAWAMFEPAETLVGRRLSPQRNGLMEDRG